MHFLGNGKFSDGAITHWHLWSADRSNVITHGPDNYNTVYFEEKSYVSLYTEQKSNTK